jgi:hypothetical protein
LARARVATFLIVGAALALIAGCETQTQDGGDGGIVFCKTDKDCPSGSNCSFPIDVGCTALGECRSFAPPADTSDCSPAMTACACSGMTIAVPACWNYLAPMAVQSTGPCGDGGIVDAGAGGG